MADQLESTQSSLERVQNYDVAEIHRPKLGEHLSFEGAVEPAKRLIVLFKQIPFEQLKELGDPELKTVQKQADGFFSILESIQSFDPNVPENNADRRNQIVSQITNQWGAAFSHLHPLISYLTVRTTDFSMLETEARAAVQGVKDEAAEAAKSLSDHEKNAEKILKTIQKVAAETGVSQQAIYYKEEADIHATEAEKWRNWTIGTAVGLGVFAVISLFIHKIEFLTPTTPYDTIQLALSKFLIFAVISYMLILCAKNFLSHKHNAIVNKHRQNALVTFKALVDAAKDKGNQDIVLTHAAECIFSPQDTGYTKQPSPNAGQPSIQTVIRTLGQGVKEPSSTP